jgi:hypothetical protein
LGGEGEAAKFEGDFTNICARRDDDVERLPQEGSASTATTTAATGRANCIVERKSGYGPTWSGCHAYVANNQCHRRQY